MDPTPPKLTHIAGLALTPSEAETIEAVLQMREGYVLDFSDKTMRHYFADTFNVDVDDRRYGDGPSLSKANRLRSVLRQSDPELAVRILRALLDRRLGSSEGRPTAVYQAVYDSVLRKLAAAISAPAHVAEAPPRRDTLLLATDLAVIAGRHAEAATTKFLQQRKEARAVHATAPVVVPPRDAPAATSPKTAIPAIQVFISHSREDKGLAEAVVEFLLGATTLAPEAIRCTSVAGYGLPTGAHSSEALRRELGGAKCVVGLITTSSARAAWVLFELGAAWGLGRWCAPILAPGMPFDTLPAALVERTAIHADDDAEMVQLLEEIVGVTGTAMRSPRHVVAAAKKLGEAVRRAARPAPIVD
jgi:hypothetical protein